MISAIKLKKYVAGVGILGFVVGKLRHGKKLYSNILLKVDKDLEVGFHHIILPLILAVRLRMEGGGEFLLDAEKIT